MKLYVFNPDADMALGNNEENYMAPATIRRMAEDLALFRFGMPGRVVGYWPLPPIMQII